MCNKPVFSPRQSSGPAWPGFLSPGGGASSLGRRRERERQRDGRREGGREGGREIDPDLPLPLLPLPVNCPLLQGSQSELAGSIDEHRTYDFNVVPAKALMDIFLHKAASHAGE